MLRRLRFLFPYYRRYRLRFAFGVLAVLLAAVIGLVSPLLVGQAVDVLREDLTRRALLVYAGLLILVELVRGVFTFTQRVVLVTMSRNIERDLRDRYFEHLTRQEQRFYQDRATGDLMARATKDLEAVRMLCGPAIMYAANTVFTATGALSFMVWLDPGLTLVALSTLPVVAVTTKVLGAKVHELFESVQASYGDLSTRMQENLAGVRVVRAYAQEAGETEQFRRENERYVEHNRRLIHWSAAFRPALQALVGIAFAAVLWRGGLLVAEGTMSVGDFVAFLLLLGKLIWPMIAIGFVINLIERGTASLGRIRKVLEREPEIVDPAADEAPAAVGEPARGPAAALGRSLEGAIRARHLDYTYPGEGNPRVLHDVDFSVPAGTTVALVGRTGAGKSTLLSLVPRLLDPPPGHLFVDGHDVGEIPFAALRGATAMVPQETFLFSTTVRENIALGRPDAPDEEILAAARHAGLSADLEGFPQGLDTLVGERGITLSGGQKQRVALARALLREPRILLLDDCLSAVDTRTEEEILGHLRRLFVGRTVLLVSHRISTVRDSDLILVLDEGRIVERGTHDELLALGGLYADLHERQLLEEELAVV